MQALVDQIGTGQAQSAICNLQLHEGCRRKDLMLTIDGVEYLEVDEAAGLLGVKKATIYAYVSRGVLDSFRQGVGRKRLYRRVEVEALREARPSAAPSAHQVLDDDVVRNVRLPDVESWAGEH